MNEAVGLLYEVNDTCFRLKMFFYPGPLLFAVDSAPVVATAKKL